MNTCDRCKHYTPAEKTKLAGYEFDGRCSKMEDWAGGDTVIDGAVAWDYENYACGVHVGPKFGCIHWVAIS